MGGLQWFEILYLISRELLDVGMGPLIHWHMKWMKKIGVKGSRCLQWFETVYLISRKLELRNNSVGIAPLIHRHMKWMNKILDVEGSRVGVAVVENVVFDF